MWDWFEAVLKEGCGGFQDVFFCRENGRGWYTAKCSLFGTWSGVCMFSLSLRGREKWEKHKTASKPLDDLSFAVMETLAAQASRGKTAPLVNGSVSGEGIRETDSEGGKEGSVSSHREAQACGPLTPLECQSGRPSACQHSFRVDQSRVEAWPEERAELPLHKRAHVF